MSQRVRDTAAKSAAAGKPVGSDTSPAEVDLLEDEETQVTPLPEDDPDQEFTGFHVQVSASDSYVETDDQPLLSVGTMVGDYRIEGVLGQGGMGTVYAAVHPLIGKKAAIKVLRPRHFDSPRAVERFVQEARSVNQIGHLNIVDIFAFGSLPDGRAYLVMEWLEGETLASRLAHGRMRFADSCDVLSQMCKALDAAHEKGIIHRDLKPDNVFLLRRRGETPMVKLLDFGIAKRTGGGATAGVHSTETGMVMGTPAYVAPEQAKGKQVGARTDVYSLGCMAYEMYLGRLPFLADTAVEVVSMHLYAEPPDPLSIDPGLPSELALLMRRMLAKDPSDRPGVAELRDCLRALQSPQFEPALRALTEPPAAPAWRAAPVSMPLPPRRRRGPLLAAVALAAAAAVSAALLVGGGEGRPAVADTDRPAETPGLAADGQPAAAPAPAEDEQPELAEDEQPELAEDEPPELADTDEAPAAAPAIPSRGTVIVAVDVAGARVRIGDARAQVVDGVARSEVAPGEPVEVVVTARGHEPFTERVVADAGEELVVDAQLPAKTAPPPRRAVRTPARRTPRRKPPRERQRDRTSDRDARDGTIDPFAE